MAACEGDLSDSDALSSDNGRLDPAVVAGLYVQHAEELRSFLTGVLRDADLAGEALQATFVKAMEVGHTARDETRKGWLFRVAYHEAMSLRRKQSQQQTSLRKMVSRQPSSASPAGPAPPDDNLRRRELVDHVRAALADLPAEQQAIVRLRIYEEKTFAQIAAELNIPLGTVLTRMRLAVKRLHQRFRTSDETP